MVREIKPFSIVQSLNNSPILDFRGTPVPEYDPKEIGASREPAKIAPQTSDSTQKPLIPSSKMDEGEASKENSSVLNVPSESNAMNSASALELSMESGEEKTSKTEKREAPTSLPKPPTSPTLLTIVASADPEKLLKALDHNK